MYWITGVDMGAIWKIHLNDRWFVAMLAIDTITVAIYFISYTAVIMLSYFYGIKTTGSFSGSYQDLTRHGC